MSWARTAAALGSMGMARARAPRYLIVDVLVGAAVAVQCLCQADGESSRSW
jgi:hypothetical protein